MGQWRREYRQGREYEQNVMRNRGGAGPGMHVWVSLGYWQSQRIFMQEESRLR